MEININHKNSQNYKKEAMTIKRNEYRNKLYLESKKKCIQMIKNYKVKIINILNNTESEINKRVDKIYVINLSEDVIKRNYIITIMKKYGINFTLVIVDHISYETLVELETKLSISINELGCCVSHLWCLYQIIYKKYKNAIIFEDDIILHKDFEKKFIRLYEKNNNIDFLLLGAHDYNFSKINYKNVKDNVYKPICDKKNFYNNLYGAHANYYSLKGAKRMFHIRTSQIDFFDKEYMLMFDYFPDSFVCYPNLALANVSESTLGHERSILSYSEKEYYNECFIDLNFNNYNFIYVNLLKNIDYIYSSDDYETLTERYLSESVGKEKLPFVKKRLVMDFFTINDVMNILYYSSKNTTTV
jgi:GR25 family glycosyltransferase involved in LPS biosynthesis